jgi:hypothetical protein
MSEPDIQPQEPGAIAGVDQGKLEAIAAGTVGDIAEALAGLTDLELAQLADLEAGGKNRKSAIGAIEAELASRIEPQEPAEPSTKATLGDDASYADKHERDVDPASLARPVLTLEGWVLPLPKASAEG